MVSTAHDYARLLQMMLNGGELDGVRIQGVVLVFMLNQLPNRSDVGAKFPTLVYQALTTIRD